MEAIWSRIDAWLAANAPEVLDALQTGATEQQIEETEIALGITFPEEVRASYRIHNGQRLDAPNASDGFGLLNAHEFLSLSRMVDEWNVWKGLLDSGEFEGVESEPDGSIRSDWWNPRWIPLTYDGSGNHYCLDLDPAPGGRVGQIITMWHDEASREVVADSFAEWLEQFADDLEAGEYVLSDEYGGLVRQEDL